jgi:hypothetical protein
MERIDWTAIQRATEYLFSTTARRVDGDGFSVYRNQGRIVVDLKVAK